jgi:hypothetical protein
VAEIRRASGSITVQRFVPETAQFWRRGTVDISLAEHLVVDMGGSRSDDDRTIARAAAGARDAVVTM